MRKAFLLICVALLDMSVPRLAGAVEIIQDDRYVYVRQGWAEMSDDRQRDLMIHFNARLKRKLSELGIPMSWDEDSEKKLLEDQGQFDRILQETRDRANRFALEGNVRLNDLAPTGFIEGIGINGSGNYVVGVGGTALVTVVVVPFHVDRTDKITRETQSYYEVGWALGGLLQVGAGVGGGGGAAGRAAIGLIWGPLPDPSALRGFALGAAADISTIAGLGVKAVAVANSVTHLHNLVAMVTFDVGAQAGGEIHGSVLYFMSVDQVIHAVSGSAKTPTAGKERIEDQESHAHP